MNYKIWKYKNSRSVSRTFRIEPIGYFFVTIMAVILLISVMSIVYVILMEKSVNPVVSEWVAAAGCFMVPMILIYIIFNLQTQTSSAQLCFARGKDGNMYVFDYGSPEFQKYAAGCGFAQVNYSGRRGIDFFVTIRKNERNMVKLIRLIDKKRILEGLIEEGRELAYGKKLVEVRYIEEKGKRCVLHCILQNRTGKEEFSNLVFAKSYEDYDELLNEFRKLENFQSKNHMDFCPFCGSRMVNRTCPVCQPMSRNFAVETGDKWKIREPRLRILNIIVFVLGALTLMGCIGVRIYQENHITYDYEKVSVLVTDVKSQGLYQKGGTDTYEVTVFYGNREYPLKNVKSGEFYMVGSKTDVYYFRGNMYSNVDGIKIFDTWGKIYFAFLGMTFAFGVSGTVLMAVRKKIRVSK